MKTDKNPWLGERLDLSQLATVEVASEEKVKKFAGTVGVGLVGLAFLGPLGLLAGMLVGGNKHNVTFIASFKDGRRLLATIDRKSFTQLQAAVF